jgi:hypothetical protein
MATESRPMQWIASTEKKAKESTGCTNMMMKINVKCIVERKAEESDNENK